MSKNEEKVWVLQLRTKHGDQVFVYKSVTTAEIDRKLWILDIIEDINLTELQAAGTTLKEVLTTIIDDPGSCPFWSLEDDHSLEQLILND